jgi:FlaG/FlaF family flagellin (archaellin)
MKFNATVTLVILLASLLLFSCSKETVDPNFTGSIEGQVQNSTTGEPLGAVSISTNPGTDAILTGPDGQFSIEEVPTGNYNVQAQKEDFEARSVRVNVKEDRTARAQILLTSDEEEPSSTNIDAEVTSFFNTTSNDSTFVEVNFRVENTSSNTTLMDYEVYFQIYTPETTFFQEFQGDSLGSGEQTIGDFRRFIRQSSADSVVVSGTFAPNPDN